MEAMAIEDDRSEAEDAMAQGITQGEVRSAGIEEEKV